MRSARNTLQAIVIITDGADQHRRLNLKRLLALTQAFSASETGLDHGLVGLGLFGDRRAVFRDLVVEGLP